MVALRIIFSSGFSFCIDSDYCGEKDRRRVKEVVKKVSNTNCTASKLYNMFVFKQRQYNMPRGRRANRKREKTAELRMLLLIAQY